MATPSHSRGRSHRPTRAAYRARQFLHALNPRIDQAGLARAMNMLEAPLLRLFIAMETRDQRHAIEVMQRLLDAGVDDRDLLTAALLHDCGKGAVPVWLRVLRVVSPQALRFVAGSTTTTGWRGAAYRLLHDTEISARLVEGTGASPAVGRFVRGRVYLEEEPQLALLLAADDAS